MTDADRSELIRRLGKFYGLDASNAWLDTPHPKLNDKCPIDLPYHEVAKFMDDTEKSAYQ